MTPALSSCRSQRSSDRSQFVAILLLFWLTAIDLVKIGRRVRRLRGNVADQVRALLKS